MNKKMRSKFRGHEMFIGIAAFWLDPPLGGFLAFLPLDEAIASRAVFLNQDEHEDRNFMCKITS